MEAALRRIHAEGKLLEGEFRPEGTHREWCDPDVLQQVRRKTLARLRREVVPAAQHTFVRLLTRWQGAAVPRRGLDALLDTIEILQGAALIASELEREILPARVLDYRPEDLDTLMASGHVVWTGREPLGDRDGRISLYLADGSAPPPARRPPPRNSPEHALRIADAAARAWARRSSRRSIRPSGGGFPRDTQAALWELVWAGLVTNDTLHPLRNLLYAKDAERPRRELRDGPPGSPEFLRRFRARTGGSHAAEGRWSLIEQRLGIPITPTEWSANTAQQLLARNGIVMRETALAENIPGGYPADLPRAEDHGGERLDPPRHVRRRTGRRPVRADRRHRHAAQPAHRARPSRSPAPRRQRPRQSLRQPASPGPAKITACRAPPAPAWCSSTARLAAFLRRRNPAIRVILPEDEPDRSRFARELARKLAEVAVRRQTRRSGLLIGEINDAPAREHFLARYLEEAGFVDVAAGHADAPRRRTRARAGGTRPSRTDEEPDA